MKVPSFSGMTSTQLHLGQFFVLFLDGFLFLFASFCLTDLCCFNNFLDKYLDSLARPLVFFETHQEGWWSLHIYFNQIPPHYSALLPHTLVENNRRKRWQDTKAQRKPETAKMSLDPFCRPACICVLRQEISPEYFRMDSLEPEVGRCQNV